MRKVVAGRKVYYTSFCGTRVLETNGKAYNHPGQNASRSEIVLKEIIFSSSYGDGRRDYNPIRQKKFIYYVLHDEMLSIPHVFRPLHLVGYPCCAIATIIVRMLRWVGTRQSSGDSHNGTVLHES